jgi:hypothetical protein
LSKSSVVEDYYARSAAAIGGSMNKTEGRGLGTRPSAAAVPAIRAVRLTAARGRYVRSRPRRRNLLLNRALNAGRAALENRKNCACRHILFGARAVKTVVRDWSVS